MTNTNIFLKSNNLLAFLAKPTASFVDHYVSSQPLNLFIPYSEYVHFVKEIVHANLDVLRTPISVYKDALSAGDHSVIMYRLYSLDIALAGLSEIVKSYRMGFQCTRIFSCIDTETSVKTVDVEFSKAIEFAAEHFTGDEMMKIHMSMQDKFPDIGTLPTNPTVSTNNLIMYYVCLSQMGVYLLGKKFIMNIKEE